MRSSGMEVKRSCAHHRLMRTALTAATKASLGMRASRPRARRLFSPQLPTRLYRLPLDENNGVNGRTYRRDGIFVSAGRHLIALAKAIPPPTLDLESFP